MNVEQQIEELKNQLKAKISAYDRRDEIDRVNMHFDTAVLELELETERAAYRAERAARYGFAANPVTVPVEALKKLKVQRTEQLAAIEARFK